MKQIFVATTNANKLLEIRNIIGDVAPEIEFVSLQDERFVAAPAQPPEDAPTFVENALIKARWGARLSNMPSLADDSGLIVPLLAGEPGIHSARYAGAAKDDRANCQKLLQQMEKRERQESSERRAYFYCTIVLMRHPLDPAPFIGGARWHGVIGKTLRGEKGFGYDPLFHPDEYPTKSVAELSSQIKNQISHRARALTKLQAFLKAHSH